MASTSWGSFQGKPSAEQDVELEPRRRGASRACRWLNKGLRLEVVSRLLGHSSTVDTERAYAELLGIKPSPEFHAAARDRLEGTEPTALARFPLIAASDFDDGVRQLKPQLELACDAIAFLTGNAVEPIAMILAAADDTFRARFFPPEDRALIHIGDRPARMPQIFTAAQTSGEIGRVCALHGRLLLLPEGQVSCLPRARHRAAVFARRGRGEPSVLIVEDVS